MVRVKHRKLTSPAKLIEQANKYGPMLLSRMMNGKVVPSHLHAEVVSPFAEQRVVAPSKGHGR